MKANQVSFQLGTLYQIPPPLGRPRIRWRTEVWWGLSTFLLALVVFFFPELTSKVELAHVRMIVGIPLLVTPLLIPLFLWLCRASSVVVQRVRLYPAVHMNARQAIRDREQLRKLAFDLATIIANETYFEIIKAEYSDGKLFVVVRRKNTRKVTRGDTLIVIHTEDNLLMGKFKVTEIRSQELYAIGISDIDPVWSGYIRQKGDLQMTPYLAAIHVPQER